MKKNTRFLALLTMIYMLIISVVSASAIESFEDYNPNHWSNAAISHAIENNIMNGYEDNTLRPDRNLSRAEMAAMLNRAFGAVVLDTTKTFDDVPKDSWYYEEVAKAVQMQTFGGTSNTTFEPERPIFREEAMVAIARAMVLEPGDPSVLTKFGDYEDVSPWAKEYVAALVECGCVNGTDKELIEPRKTVTRAQFARMLYNIFENYISKPGTYSVNTERSLMINSPDVVLENCTINGDLVLGDGVHDGFVKTYNVKVKGRILIRGGNKVTFTTTTTDKNVVVKALNGTVNFQNYRTNRIFKNIKEYTDTTYLRNTSSNNDTKNVYFTVEYYIPDGTGGYTKHSDRKVSASSGTAVDAKDYVITIDGYEFDETITTDRTGTVSSDNSLIVKAYYKKLYTVTFYRWDEDEENWVVHDTVSDLSAGDTVSSLPVYSDEMKRGYQTGNGRTHNVANSLYSTNFVHKISSTWSYDNGEKIAEFTSDTKVYEDLDVYPYFKGLFANVYIEKYKDVKADGIDFEVYYDDSRFIDSLKDAIWVNKGSITTALDMINIDGKLIEKLNENKLTDTEGKIYNQEQRVRLADLFGDDLDKFVRDSAKENVTEENAIEFLNTFLSNADNEATATELIQDLIDEATPEEINYTFKPAIEGFLDKDATLLEEQIRKYVSSHYTPDDIDNEINTMMKPENKVSTIETIMGELFAEGNDDVLHGAINDIVKSSTLRADVIDVVVDHLFHPTNPNADKKEELVDMVVDELYTDTIEKFLKELREEEQFTVYNEFTDLIAKAMYDRFYGMSLEEFLDTVSLPDGFDKVLQVDVIKRVLNDIYNDALNPYLAQIQTVRNNWANDRTQSYYIDTYVTVRIDPIDDLVNPFYDKFRELLDEKVGDVRPYRDNPYVVAMVDLMSPKYLLPALEGSYDDVLYSGYRLPTIDEAYTILYTLVVLADDAANWYLDNYDTDKVNAIIDKMENTVIEYADCILSFVNEYKEHGTIPSLDDLPDSKLTELCEKYGIQDIIDRNEKIQAIIEKITANEKFNNVIDKFYNSSYNSPISSERYQNIATKVKKFFSLVFDNYQDETFNLDKFFNEAILDKVSEYRVETAEKHIADMYKATNGENCVTVTREFADE